MYIRKLTKQVICDYGQAEVKTKAGWLRGVISDDTYVFRGVEYAEGFMMCKAYLKGTTKPILTYFLGLLAPYFERD